MHVGVVKFALFAWLCMLYLKANVCFVSPNIAHSNVHHTRFFYLMSVGFVIELMLATFSSSLNPQPEVDTFALTMTPVALSLEELLPQGAETLKYRSASILIRTALVISTIGVAVLVPFFGESCIRRIIFRVSNMKE